MFMCVFCVLFLFFVVFVVCWGGGVGKRDFIANTGKGETKILVSAKQGENCTIKVMEWNSLATSTND